MIATIATARYDQLLPMDDAYQRTPRAASRSDGHGLDLHNKACFFPSMIWVLLTALPAQPC